MAETVVISSKEINILLNILVSKTEHISIYSPLLGVELLNFNFYNLKEFEIVNKSEFTSITNELKNRIWKTEKKLRGYLFEEIPNYIHLRDALQASGVLPFKRIKELLLEIEEILSNYPSVREPKLPILALDTNAFYMRLPTNYLSKLKTKPTLVISNGVYQEISNNSNRSLDNRRLLSKLKSLFSYTTGIEEIFFLGVESFKARRALLALSELIKTEKEFKCFITEARDYGDEAILNSYKKFEQEQRSRVIFITLDEKARALAMSPHIALENRYIEQVSVEEIRSSTNLTYESLPRLLYTLATYFMLIRVSCGTDQVLIEGVWNSKSREDWIAENIKIKAQKAIIRKIVNRIEKSRKIAKVLEKTRSIRP